MVNWKLNSAQKQSMVTSLSAAIAAFLIIILLTLSIFIIFRGSYYFWPQSIQHLIYQQDAQQVPQQLYALPTATTMRVDQQLLHFKYSSPSQLVNGQATFTSNSISATEPEQPVARILLSNGGLVIAEVLQIVDDNGHVFDIENFSALRDTVVSLEDQIDHIRSGELANIHNRLADMARKNVEQSAPARQRLSQRFFRLQKDIEALESTIGLFQLKLRFADGQQASLSLFDVRQIDFPNSMSFSQKLLVGLSSFSDFITDSPKLDNTSGGVFPALFGTIVMVLLMTILVTPFGVLAALYLHEYAPQNKTTALIRISVNNLAGVPSIVYGVFGLGFFVYTLGGNIDEILFSDNLPSPTFGAPGLFWASLTMAILTLPVVIVATEEGLRRVPKALRDGSYALGATQAETTLKMVLPIASPGIMTGVILAIARGAGEVAPLMLVGAVKFAPALPVDGDFPFVHLQRQFMHLGVLIYDGAFHSQNIGNGSSFVFACCMLLLIIVFTLNLVAVFIRNRLRNQYSQNF
ncbi:phosphate ABC transporter permease PstA [Aliiglaciecola sp. LCG003]|uniref:phosphate ABC transporter permease PstA n=1 Tax=Aliiglaciecola sp. LCG003 TaxID=3053655 RepID=UPI002573CD82|nr:phosphate ABC transporter permease PstA [Aliiglaciecola sp. LCG003]WJG08636.1 phosphate ABC transporter permease PstA [Aliiglaciecola sp. LCG003]